MHIEYSNNNAHSHLYCSWSHQICQDSQQYHHIGRRVRNRAQNHYQDTEIDSSHTDLNKIMVTAWHVLYRKPSNLFLFRSTIQGLISKLCKYHKPYLKAESLCYIAIHCNIEHTALSLLYTRNFMCFHKCV